MDLALNFDQLTFLLKLLNPDADIRKIDPRFNHGENILFSKIPGDRLKFPLDIIILKKKELQIKIKTKKNTLQPVKYIHILKLLKWIKY